MGYSFEGLLVALTFEQSTVSAYSSRYQSFLSYVLLTDSSFSAVKLLVGLQEGHLACKNDGYWYVSMMM